ncbi:hypothetical protein ACNHKD_17020 [Methylocystis sp. JAN1]|uniref:hypothetical protein n=1 Tax=Methylocystis sp. JAN1 TaxID=3397211 RepID=UPI003FA24AA4
MTESKRSRVAKVDRAPSAALQAPRNGATEPQTDPALAAMMRCYLSKPRIAWPYLALLLGSMAFLVLALFLPE